MAIEILNIKLIPLTDEEIILCQRLLEQYKNADASPLANAFASAGLGAGGGIAYLGYSAELDRRRFLKQFGATSALVLGGSLLPSFTKESEAVFWAVLARVAVSVVVAIGAGIVANLITNKIVEARSTSRGGYSYPAGYSYSTADGPVAWDRGKGGIVTTVITNPYDEAQSGNLQTQLRNDGGNELESDDLIEIDGIPPDYKSEITFSQDNLPYTGKKKYSIRSNLNLGKTQFPIYVQD